MLTVQVSYRTIVYTVLVLVGIYALFRLWPIVLLIVTALIFMSALQPYVNWLEAKGIPRTVAVLMIFVAVMSIIAGLFALVIPAMVDEFQSIRDDLPGKARQLEDFLANFGINVELEQRARDVNWGELISGSQAYNYGQRVLLTILSIFTIIVLTVYLLIDAPRLSRFIYQFVPPGREPELERILRSLERVVGGYVRGQLITSVCIALFTLVVLLILRVPNAVAFAVLAGFADIIPVFGAFIATVPPVVAAFDVSTSRAILVLGLLIAYQQFEDRFLTPTVYGSSLNLPPLVVLIAILAGGELFGIAGILLALPAAAVGRVVLDYFLDRRAGGFAPSGPRGEPLAPDEPAQEG
jgi:predicted PurR-regulated permease PerM